MMENVYVVGILALVGLVTAYVLALPVIRSLNGRSEAIKFLVTVGEASFARILYGGAAVDKFKVCNIKLACTQVYVLIVLDSSSDPRQRKDDRNSDHCAR